MFVGLPNPNIIMPLEKMTITAIQKNKKIYVLYNPESYRQERSIRLTEQSSFSTDTPMRQYAGGGPEKVSFQLFFDTFSAGAEVGGDMLDRAKFTGNSLLPSAAKMLDVRDYTKKIYNLMRVDSSLHEPARLKLEWASLQFTGYLVSCTQAFTKFNERGIPVRATLDCVFEEANTDSVYINPYESPDTTKYRTVTQGDSLWALSAKEYGQPEQWREIAAANGLSNPRRLRTGETLVLPALD